MSPGTGWCDEGEQAARSYRRRRLRVALRMWLDAVALTALGIVGFVAAMVGIGYLLAYSEELTGMITGLAVMVVLAYTVGAVHDHLAERRNR